MKMEMKFKTKEIVNILNNHQGNLDKKSFNTIFSCIKIEQKENLLYIVSSDGQNFLQHTIEQETKENFIIIINGYLLFELLKKTSNEFFEIIIENNKYIIKIDHSVFEFAMKETSDYNLWANNEEQANLSFEIESSLLKKSLNQIKWASSKEDTRPILNTVLFHLKNNSLNLCATDTLRLAIMQNCAITNVVNHNNISKFIVHKKAINELIKLLDAYEEILEIQINKFIQINFKKNKIIWKALIIAGDYPNYEKLLSLSQNENVFETNVTNLINTIEKILIIGNIIYPNINLNFTQNTLEAFTSTNSSVGRDFVFGKYEGENMNTKVNGRLLIELLHNLEGPILIKMQNSKTPLTIQEKNNENKTFIIAPMKNEENVNIK